MRILEVFVLKFRSISKHTLPGLVARSKSYYEVFPNSNGNSNGSSNNSSTGGGGSGSSSSQQWGHSSSSGGAKQKPITAGIDKNDDKNQVTEVDCMYLWCL